MSGRVFNSSLITHHSSLQVQYRPVVVQSRLAEAHVRVDGRGVADDGEHGQVAHAVAVGVGVAQVDVVFFSVGANPRSLGGGGEHGGQQSSGGDAVDELQAVGDEVVHAEVLHQGRDRKIERAGDDDLLEAEAARLLNQGLRA